MSCTAKWTVSGTTITCTISNIVTPSTAQDGGYRIAISRDGSIQGTVEAYGTTTVSTTVENFWKEENELSLVVYWYKNGNFVGTDSGITNERITAYVPGQLTSNTVTVYRNEDTNGYTAKLMYHKNPVYLGKMDLVSSTKTTTEVYGRYYFDVTVNSNYTLTSPSSYPDSITNTASGNKSYTFAAQSTGKTKYSVTASRGSGGTVTLYYYDSSDRPNRITKTIGTSSSTTIVYGSYYFEVKPSDGYEIDTSNTTSEYPSSSISAQEGTDTYKFVFKEKPHTVTIKTDFGRAIQYVVSNSTSTPSSGWKDIYGNSSEVISVTNNRYVHFRLNKSISGNSTSLGFYDGNNNEISKYKQITANTTIRHVVGYPVNLSVGSHGHGVDVNNNGINKTINNITYYADKTTVTYTVYANRGYVFNRWENNSLANIVSNSFTIDGQYGSFTSVNDRALFTAITNTHTLTFKSNSSWSLACHAKIHYRIYSTYASSIEDDTTGNISAKNNINTMTLYDGESVEFYLIVDDGYKYDIQWTNPKWSPSTGSVITNVIRSENDRHYASEITSNLTISLNYYNGYKKINIINPNGGLTNFKIDGYGLNSSGNWVGQGDNFSISAELENNNYTFSGWYNDDSKIGSNLSLSGIEIYEAATIEGRTALKGIIRIEARRAESQNDNNNNNIIKTIWIDNQEDSTEPGTASNKLEYTEDSASENRFYIHMIMVNDSWEMFYLKDEVGNTAEVFSKSSVIQNGYTLPMYTWHVNRDITTDKIYTAYGNLKAYVGSQNCYSSDSFAEGTLIKEGNNSFKIDGTTYNNPIYISRHNASMELIPPEINNYHFVKWMYYDSATSKYVDFNSNIYTTSMQKTEPYNNTLGDRIFVAIFSDSIPEPQVFSWIVNACNINDITQTSSIPYQDGLIYKWNNSSDYGHTNLYKDYYGFYVSAQEWNNLREKIRDWYSYTNKAWPTGLESFLSENNNVSSGQNFSADEYNNIAWAINHLRGYPSQQTLDTETHKGQSISAKLLNDLMIQINKLKE